MSEIEKNGRAFYQVPFSDLWIIFRQYIKIHGQSDDDLKIHWSKFEKLYCENFDYFGNKFYKSSITKIVYEKIDQIAPTILIRLYNMLDFSGSLPFVKANQVFTDSY